MMPTVEAAAEAIYHATHGRDAYSFALTTKQTQDRCRSEARAVLALFPEPARCRICEGLGFMAYGVNAGMPCGDCDGGGTQ